MVKLIFEKYGREHCAVVGGFSTFQARSAFAEVAKVLGVGERDVRKFTEHFPWSFGGSWEPNGFETPQLVEMLRASPETKRPAHRRGAIQDRAGDGGVPRWCSALSEDASVRCCSSRQPMHELTPTFIANKGYATTHFDMDAVEAIGLVKMDILAQGGLAAMRDVSAMLEARDIELDLEKCVAREKHNGQLLVEIRMRPSRGMIPKCGR